MSRRILCLKCGDEWKMHPGDAQMGFTFRKCFVSLHTQPPTDHGTTIITESETKFEPMPEYHCDLCCEVISGSIVLAVTMTPPGRSIPSWEDEYGKVMSDEEVEAYRKISK